MATLDEGVVNLQRFVGLLANATSATEQVGDRVKEAARRFADLEGEAEEEGGGLNDHLTELGSTLQTEEAEAVEAITELIQAAQDAQDTVGDAQEKVERAASDLESKASDVENDLEQASTQLTSEGFTPLDQAVAEAQQELESESQEEEQAFTELEGAVGGFQSEAEAAWNEAEGELEEATGDLTEAETALEAAATEGVQGFTAAADEMETACTTLQSEVDLIYDALDSGVEAQGTTWQQAVQGAGQEALTFVTDAEQQRLAQPAAMVEDEALATLDQEYEAVGDVLDAAGTAVADLEPLAEDLVKCQSVLSEVNALMDALA